MARIAVVGAGAAGTMAAIFAAESAPPATQVLLLERTKDGGRKILISGGGRCNILPAHVDESRFVTDSPRHLLRGMVRSWPLREQIAFFQDRIGLPLLEETGSAKLFPASNSARDVRDRLLVHAQRAGVTLLTNTDVIDYGPSPSGSGWAITTKSSARGSAVHVVDADALIVATGGLSVPSTGSDGRGLAIAERLGHTIRALYPALTPLTANPAPFTDLSGVSLRVTITARAPRLEARAEGGFLFTHGGYSGPAVLDVSHVAVRSRAQVNSPARLVVQWAQLDDRDWEAALKPRAARSILHAVAEHLPLRLAEALLIGAGIRPDLSLSQLSREARLRVIDVLVRTTLPWTGDEGYKKAEVTGGGVLLSEIDPHTMESRKRRRLYFCGEMLDAFGPIGGYNFLWAWATGRAAGIGAGKMLC
jgi:predicted Rossmann fold flavoprotein